MSEGLDNPTNYNLHAEKIAKGQLAIRNVKLEESLEDGENSSSMMTTDCHPQHEPTWSPTEMHTAGDWLECLQHKIYCREEEEAILLRTYLMRKNPANTNKSTSGEFCLISGSSGLGKSRLARTLKEAVEDDDGYFISTKFDRVRQAKPTRIFADAFSEFTQFVIDKGEDVINCMKTCIREALGDELGILTSAIPDIKRIVGDPLVEPVQVTYQLSERFVFALHDLIGAVCTPMSPVVIFFDDLQYSHPNSLRLLRLFISCNQNKSLFIIGSCDTDNLGPGSSFSGMIHDLESTQRTPVFRIEVSQKPVHVIRDIIVETLPMAKGRENELAEVVLRQTHGVCLYVLEFLRWLFDQSLLEFDSAQSTWRLVATEHPLVNDSLVYLSDFWIEKLKHLAIDVREMLTCAACFGNNIDERILSIVLPKDDLWDRLHVATRKHVLVYEHGRGYSFRHEGLQMAALALIPANDEAHFHLTLGRKLLDSVPEEERGRYIYMVVGQMRLCRQLIVDPAEKYSLSSMCLSAGKSAACGSTFGSAAEYLDFGLELLEEGSWDMNFQLTYELHITAARVHMTLSNYGRVQSLIQAVLDNACDLHYKAPAQVMLIYMEGVTDKQHSAVDDGIRVLNELGEAFRRQHWRAPFGSELRKVQTMLKGKTNDDIKNMRTVQDERKRAALQILNILLLNVIKVRPIFGPFIHLKAMEITLKHGLSPLSSIAFAGYAMLCATRGQFDEAFRFAQLSLELLQQSGSKEYIPRVYASVYGFVHVWRRPLCETLIPLKLGHKIGSRTGDIEFACLDANLYSASLFFSGTPLPVVCKEVGDMISLMSARQQQSMVPMVRPFYVVAQNLMGLTRDPLNMEEDALGFDAAPETRIMSSKVVLGLHFLILRYLFGAYVGAKNTIPKVESALMQHPGIKQIFSFFFIAMIRIAMARRTQGLLRLIYLWKAKRTLEQFKKRTLKTPKQNYLPMKLLMEAEFSSAIGENKRANEKFIAAFEMASKSGFRIVEAMSYECAGRHRFANKDASSATSFFKKALSVYEEWGARGKLQHLQEELKQLYASKDFPLPTI